MSESTLPPISDMINGARNGEFTSTEKEFIARNTGKMLPPEEHVRLCRAIDAIESKLLELEARYI